MCSKNFTYLALLVTPDYGFSILLNHTMHELEYTNLALINEYKIPINALLERRSNKETSKMYPLRERLFLTAVIPQKP